jgi:hypothetical protein
VKNHGDTAAMYVRPPPIAAKLEMYVSSVLVDPIRFDNRELTVEDRPLAMSPSRPGIDDTNEVVT